MNEMKFPIEVLKIKHDPLYHDHNKPDGMGCKCGQLVSIRPCAEKYGKKSFLGIMIGNLPYEAYATYNPENKELSIRGYRNPAIYVPDLQEIIWGCESWWGEINSEEELHQISDDDIQNVWYVKLLKSMQEKNKNET